MLAWLIAPFVNLGKEHIVHFPIGHGALFPGAAGGIGGYVGLGMNVQREIVEDEQNLTVGNLVIIDRGKSLGYKAAAERALVVGIFFDEHRGIGIAAIRPSLFRKTYFNAIGVYFR